MEKIVPPTLRDVAKEAGVSMPTVSRVLGGKVKVSQEKVDAVNEAIRKLNYRPNTIARSLAAGTKNTIGVIAHNTVRFGYSQTIDGIRSAASAAGYSVAIVVVESGDEADIERAVELIMGQPVLGVITILFDPFAGLVIPRLVDITYVAAVGGYDDPLVVESSDRGRMAVPHAVIDDVGAGYEATKYLLDQGSKTVHFMSIPPWGTAFGRNTGWYNALVEAGAEIPPIIEAQYDSHSGYELGEEVARRFRQEGLSALLCGNDELALGAIARLQDEGIRVPEDVAIIGFDNQEFGEFVRPAITTMELDFIALGRVAFESLIDYAKHGTVTRKSLVGSKMHKRNSA